MMGRQCFYRLIMVSIAILAPALCGWAQDQPATQPQNVSLTVVGVSAAKSVTENGMEVSAAVGIGSPGTSVFCVLTDDFQSIIGLDEGSSVISAMRDDKGKNLSSPAVTELPELFQTYRKLRLALRSDDLASKDATRLTITGKLVVTVGSKEKTISQNRVELKQGSRIVAGPITGIVQSAESRGWGNEEQQQVTISSKMSMDAIKDITFVGDQGKAIKARKTMTFEEVLGEDVTYTVDYMLEGSAKVVGPQDHVFRKDGEKGVSIRSDSIPGPVVTADRAAGSGGGWHDEVLK